MQSLTVKRGVWRIPSFSSKRKTYNVHYSGIYGRWCCDCPDWQNRRRLDGTNCKHVAQVIEIIDTWPMDKLKEIGYEH